MGRFLGIFCRHQWHDTGERITSWNRRRFALSIQDAEKEYCVGIRHVQRCSQCGAVRSVSL